MATTTKTNKSTLTRTGRNRLLKLADHLARGKLGHKKFYFAAFNSLDAHGEYGLGHIVKFDRKRCGTLGCAIGECPIVFKRHWEFGRNHDPKLRHSRKRNNLAAEEFFGITERESSGLFIPNFERPWAQDAERLEDSATSKQVAQSIREFVKWKDAGNTYGYDYDAFIPGQDWE